MCVLYFDIGNTNTKIGVETKEASLVSYTLPTDERQTADGFGLSLLALLQSMHIAPENVTACVGSSVVPGMTIPVRNACSRYLGKELLLTPEDIPIPLENHYARPHEVGADRLVAAYAARKLFPDTASIISVDFGTATTFDCVEGNAYIGGLICPGVFSSASALAARTAKLPRISLEVTESIPTPGRCTSTSLNHGFLFGFAAMTEGLVTRLSQSMQHPIAIVGTGGFSESLAKISTCFHTVRPDLVLEGLRVLHKQHKHD